MGWSKSARFVFLQRGLGETVEVLHKNSKIVLSVASSQLIASGYSRVTILTIGIVYGPLEAGYYAFAERLAGGADVFSSAIGDVYRQRAAKRFASGREFRSLMLAVLRITVGVSVVPFLLVLLLIPNYFAVVFGETWAPASFTMMAVVVGTMASFNSAPVDKAPVIVGAHRYIVIVQGLRFIVELLPAVFAWSTDLGYESYLIIVIFGRCVVYAIDTGVGYVLARGDDLR